MNKMQGEVNKSGSENGVRQQCRAQMSPVCSAFSKNWLPTIFETECSPHKQFSQHKVDYLQSRYQSRLIQQQPLTQSNFSNDSRLLTIKERELLWKVYEKEKELVMLEDKMYMLKNSNECLRETIEEMGRERVGLEGEVERAEGKVERAVQELEKVREGNQLLQEQNRQLRQKIDELNQQIFQLNQKLLLSQQQEPSLQQYPNYPSPQFFTNPHPNLNPSPTTFLHQQIHSLKQFYQQQLYTIINKHQTSIQQLQQNLTQTLRQKLLLSEKCNILQKEIQRVTDEKKEMLGYYLGVVEEMKGEVEGLGLGGWGGGEQKSFDMLADYRDNACLSHQGYSFDRSIDITQILKLQKENHLLMNLLGKTLGKSVIDKNINHSLLQTSVNGSRRNSKSIKKSGSSSSLNKTQNLFQRNYPSLKPSSSIIPHSKYTQRVVPSSRYRPSPTKPTKDYFGKTTPSNLMPTNCNPTPTQSRPSHPNSTYHQKQQQIDQKLQQIKDKLTQQLTLT